MARRLRQPDTRRISRYRGVRAPDFRDKLARRVAADGACRTRHRRARHVEFRARKQVAPAPGPARSGPVGGNCDS